VNLLVDTDVLLDLALARRPHEAPASLLFDALQAAAVACGASFIVTRNLRDYVSSPVPARTPVSLLPTLRG
jgi:predicted nucleic acid-binding protein